MKTRELFLLALGFSLWTGLLETIPVLVAPAGGVVIRLSPDYPWMTPAGNFVFFGLAALVLRGLSHWHPVLLSRRVVLGVFGGLMALALALFLERIHPLASLLLALGVGVQVWRSARPEPRSARVRWTLVGLGLLLVVGGTVKTTWERWSEKRQWIASLPEPAAGAPNILLIILDTVRGVSLDVLGDGLASASRWDPIRTPTLEELARESVVFRKAMAPSPWTLPSHASMFTGRWPNLHGGGRAMAVEWTGSLGPEYPTIAEVLRRRGYFTAGFVGNLVFTSRETGLARGFITYEDYTRSLGQVVLSCALGRRFSQIRLWRKLVGYHDTLNRKDAATVTDQFLRWHRGRDDRPYFAFLNFFDAHEPFFPPDSVKEALPPGSHWDRFEHFVGLLTGATAWRTRKWEMNPPEQTAYAAGYREGILQADRELGRLLEELGSRGEMENTIIIVASDHGEQLGEHRLYNHNNSLYLPLLHVPLLIRDPREEPARRAVDEVVSLRDLGSTIVELAGIDPGPRGIQGRSLSRYWQPRPTGEDGSPLPLEPDTIFATLNRGAIDQSWYPVVLGPTMFSLTDSLYHYIRNGDGTEELYDLRSDAAELNDLAEAESSAAVLVGFRETLRSMVGPLPEAPSER